MSRSLRTIVVATAALVVMLAMAAAATAQNEHFIRASGNLNNDGSLTVSFKEAGLGTNQLINYALTADATATYVCVNRGGANPSAQNKTTVSGPVIATGTFSSGKNGPGDRLADGDAAAERYHLSTGAEPRARFRVVHERCPD